MCVCNFVYNVSSVYELQIRETNTGNKLNSCKKDKKKLIILENEGRERRGVALVKTIVIFNVS